MKTEKKLFLLDAMALIYRAYFAMSRNPRINSKGLNTSAVLGFANTLLEILQKEKPTHIGVAFDTKAPTVRHDSFTEYKANREKMPEDLSASIPYVKELIKRMNIPILSVDGYEADDVIGTLSKEAEKAGFEVYMMTPDKDFGQLVSENIFMYKPARMGKGPEILGVEEICKRYHLKEPTQFIDILGLWGDASDNIPGVPGIGQKTAMKLIEKYGSIENLLKNTDDLKGKQKENVENFSAQALMSKELATIILDVPIAFEENELEITKPNVEELKQLFDELEFRNFAQRYFSKLSIEDSADEQAVQGQLFADLPTEEPEIQSEYKTIDDTDHTYHLTDTLEKAAALAKLLNKQQSFCFDTETTGVDANKSELVGISFAFEAHEAWYVPVSENYNEAREFLHIFKSVLENNKIEKIG
ncbi:MAG: DNA polymerase I, partial [Bacteroidetes bacterium]